MFAIAANYLMGWAMAAADGARKQVAEWPPHPDRLFMALCAGWFESGSDPEEGNVLRWLEALPPPALAASGAEQRESVIHYVPVNDAAQSSAKTVKAVVAAAAWDSNKARDAGLAQLPEWRVRKPRRFPVAIPDDPVVHFIWTAELPAAYSTPLDALCRKVTSVGHSASLVQAWLDLTPPPPAWVPSDGATGRHLRVSGAGRLAYLELRANRQQMLAYSAMDAAVKQAKGSAKVQLRRTFDERFPIQPVSLRPEPGRWQTYVTPQVSAMSDDIAGSDFDDRLVVLALSGRRPGLQTTLRLTAALRGALLSSCQSPFPIWLSGHSATGEPAREPHLAMLPLPFVGAPHADGRLMGLAIALPRSLPAAEAARVLGPFLRDGDGLPREIRLFDGGAFDCTAQLEARERPPAALLAGAWVGPARLWATVTPIVLDRHVDGPDRWERAAEVVAAACERIGLPRPVDVLLHPNASHEGVPPSRVFAPLVRKRGGGRLAHSHAVIRFDTEVCGPVTVGAGRFRGYGLCRPLHQGDGRA